MGARVKWTEEAIRAEAAKYPTKNNFRLGSSAAYLAMIKRFPSLSNAIFGEHRAVATKWTEGALRELARTHQTAGDLKKANPSAYVTLMRKFPGLIDSLFATPPKKRPVTDEQRAAIARRIIDPSKRKWNEIALRAEAAKYETKADFAKGSFTAYSAMLKYHPGLISELFDDQGPANRFWTEELLRAEAIRYSTKAQFQKRGASAYVTTLKRFPYLLDELFDNQLEYWNKGKLYSEASKYSTKVDFQAGSGSAYVTMLKRFPGIIDELFKNQNESWDEDKLRKLAATCVSKVEFKSCNPSAYHAMRTRFSHLLEELFINQLESWNEEKLRDEIIKYKTKSELRRGNSAAYARLLTRFSDRIDEFCSHMEAGFRASDNDAIYIWKAGQTTYNGKPVYKIGVTSERTGNQRIYEVASDSGFAAEIMIVRSVSNANKLELTLHLIGDNPKFTGFNGCTEFRALSDDEIDRVVKMIENAAILYDDQDPQSQTKLPLQH